MRDAPSTPPIPSPVPLDELRAPRWAISTGSGEPQLRGTVRSTLPLDAEAPLAALASHLRAMPDDDWWAPATFERGHRKQAAWQSSCAVGVDLDYHDETGAHAPLPASWAEAVDDVLRRGPGSIAHRTPRGLRVLFVLDALVDDEHAHKRAARGAAALVLDELAPDLPMRAGPTGEGLVLDEPVGLDRARFWWGPRGRPVLELDRLYSARELAAHAPAELPVTVTPRALPRPEARPGEGAVRDPARYIEGAVQRAVDRVARAANGGRNHELNATAHGLFRTLEGLGEPIDGAWARLADAARSVGLEDDEVRRTLASAADAASRSPRALEVARPEAPARRGRPRAEDVPRPEGEDDRPVIMVDRADLGGMIDAAERALLAAGTVFVGAGHRLVRLHRGRPTDAGIKHASDAPIIAAVDADWLRTELAARARFVATSADGKARDCYPPREVIAGVLARGGWPFPALDALADGPVLRPDGTAATRSGYDAGARVWIEATGEPVTVPERASHEDARRAARRLLEPFAEFPFLGAEDRAVALAAVLTIVARPAIDGPCPLFAVSATSPASGKGLLAAIVSRIATGREPAVMSQGRDPDETRKRVLALALDGAPLVLVDNVVGTLGDGPMAAALTGGAVVDRVLGETRMVRAPMRAVWFATGNNLAFSADVGRRVLLARLDPGCAHPEDRVFREPDVLGTVMRRRGELLSAALVVLLAFVQAGRPKHRGGSRMGSFEAWDDLVRSCLLWLDLDELGDPCGTRSAVRADADRDLEALRALVLAWHENLGPQRARTMRAVVDHAAQHRGHSPELEDALLAIDPAATDRLTPKSLGIALRVHLGRWVVTEPGRAMRLVLAGQTRDGVNEYRLDVDDRRQS